MAIQDRNVAASTLALLKEIRDEFDEIKNNADRITADCKYGFFFFVVGFCAGNLGLEHSHLGQVLNYVEATPT